jgi:hypothetical protein
MSIQLDIFVNIVPVIVNLHPSRIRKPWSDTYYDYHNFPCDDRAEFE